MTHIIYKYIEFNERMYAFPFPLNVPAEGQKYALRFL